MSDYFRPSFDGEYKKKIEKFLDRNEHIPFDSPKSFMKFCTDQMMIETENSQEQIKKEQERIRNELKESIEELE